MSRKGEASKARQEALSEERSCLALTYIISYSDARNTAENSGER
jgi:hypothetical protein